jgi:hypothetical protein
MKPMNQTWLQLEATVSVDVESSASLAADAPPSDAPSTRAAADADRAPFTCALETARFTSLEAIPPML